MLYAGHPNAGVLVGLNSKRVEAYKFSSFLGEIKALSWALHDVKRQVVGQNLVVQTDSESISLRVSNCKAMVEKKLLDVRINRLLAWIWTNSLGGQLEVKYIP